MRKRSPLQSFNYQDSPYERPNQKWVCGKLDQGCPCEIGPDKKGRCRADFECKPKENNSGNGWVCTRSSAYGGTCSDGPLPDGTCCKSITPCSPGRSIRYKRSLAIKWCTVVTLAILLVFVSSESNQQFISPGDLTYQHANNTDCSSCHTVFKQGITGWIHKAFSADNILENNTQCLNCHQFGVNAADAHSLPKAELKKTAHSTTADHESPEYQTIACMSCHIEHHGTNENLKKVNRQDCALCHDLPTKNGRKVHPEFRHYPYKQRTGIIFDHHRHEGKHFFDKSGENRKLNAPDSCLSCHVSDANGIKMVVRDYQKTCKECHNSLFEESESFPVFTVPALNEEYLDSIGTYWPEDADGELTPFMKLMISNNGKMLAALSDLEDGDLTELDNSGTVDVAWAVKELFYDIYKNGDKAIAGRLANAYHCELNDNGRLIQEPACKLTVEKLNALVNSFSLPLFCQSQQEWFPNLSKFFIFMKNKWNLQNTTNTIFCEQLLRNPPPSSEFEPWSLDYFTLGYRPTNHANDFFSAWLEATRNHQGKEEIDYARKDIFSILTSDDTAGQCNKCHSLDSDEPDNYLINWEVPDWNPKRKDFIRFNHAGHLLNQEEKVCMDCHKNNKQGDYLASYEHHQPLQFDSNFATGKQVCETCHAEAMQQNQCQTCHNYHVSGISDNTLSNQNQMGVGNIKIWTDKTEYKVGDQITISFSVDLPMYVRIVRIDSSGKILSLFPNDFRPDHYSKPRVVYNIPKQGSERTLTILPPAGTDKLLAVGSPDPIAETDLFFNQFDEFDEEKMAKFTVRATHFITIKE